MPRVALSYHQKAEYIVKDFKTLCLGRKADLKLSWEAIAREMNIPRTTLTYKWDNGLLTLTEWLELCHILGVGKEDIKL